MSDAEITQIFTGEQLIISHDGLSQYRGSCSSSAGRSACGLAALNCAYLAFKKQGDDVVDVDLLRWLSSREGIEEITSICDLWTDPSHLEMEDILKTPYFENSLSLVETHYDHCGLAAFRTLLENMQKASTGIVAVIITKPPEIVACIKLSTSNGDVFLIFDSHIRPNHPTGAGLIFNISLETSASYLSRLLTVDDTENDDSFGLQMDLIRQFCGHVVVPRYPFIGDKIALSHSLLGASISILAHDLKNTNLKNTTISLTAELREANQTISHLRKCLADMENTSHGWAPSGKHENRYYFHLLREQGNPMGSDIILRRSREGPSAVTPRFWQNLQGQPDIGPSHASHKSKFFHDIPGKDRPRFDHHDQQQVDRRGNQGRDSVLKKNEYRSRKGKGRPAGILCAACLESSEECEVTVVTKCRHQFCRYCLGEYVTSSLHQEFYPIPCPLCVAENNASPRSGALDDKTVSRLVTEEYRSVFERLRRNGPFDLIHCPLCKAGAYLSQREHRNAKTLTCSSTNCSFLWCKECKQEVISDCEHVCRGPSGARTTSQKSFAQAVSLSVHSKNSGLGN